VTEWDPRSEAARDVLKLLAEVSDFLQLAPRGAEERPPDKLASRAGPLGRMQGFLSKLG
jgi:hypothetical protein